MTLHRVFMPLLVLLLLAACGEREERGPVVLAAASTQEAVEEIADAWAGEEHMRPVLSFAGTPSLARQIEAGAPADLFLSADRRWMDFLVRSGAVDARTVGDVAGNRLVLVGAPGNGPFATVEEYLRAEGTVIAMGEPDTVPAGRYARQSLEVIGLWAEVRGRIVTTDNVRAALALVERGEADLGIVYASDAAAAGPQRVAILAPFSDSTHEPIRYPAAVLARSRHPEAWDLRAFLSSPRAQAIFARHGFSAPQGQEP